MKGLEDQLLGRVIRMEKSDLETERLRLVEDVLEHKATMKELEDNLLEKLNSVEGSLGMVSDNMSTRTIFVFKKSQGENFENRRTMMVQIRTLKSIFNYLF